jgi:sulfur transfer complex TusBCD TusB component (DsrH family)
VRVLHLIRDPDEQFGLDLVRHQAATDEVAVVLIQEGVRMAPPPDVPTFALADDLRARGDLAGPQLIDAPELIRLLETHERVFVW